MKAGEIVPETMTNETTFTTIRDPVLEEGDADEVASTEGLGEDGEPRVTISTPVLEMVLPFEKVTLPGSKLTIVSKVKTTEEDTEKFNKYFKHASTCYNLDAGTAHPCWSIFDENSLPFVADLEPGVHTLEGSISHPETGRGIEQTATETRTFFTAGDGNEAATVIVTVEVDGEQAEIPVAEGGDANTQGLYFCGLRGIEDDSCVDYVAQKIVDAWR